MTDQQTTSRVPKILGARTIAESRYFAIEELDLEFSNGERRTYERLPARGYPAVIVVAVNEQRELMLIREYAAGFHEIQLTLPKGAAERGETLAEAANRELKEEIGYGAQRISELKHLNLAPGHMGFTIHAMLAQDLYAQRLPGDEPVPPELVTWPLARFDELLASDSFWEARAIAALCLARPFLGC
ncbi:MAG: ADP compounds hydrolase NudE [Pseudomonadales bacterium]|jgi:ADP-ribose diphosphatase|nr:ADP compounds hydrolase NudE [Pseudomonadales bacterium]MDP6469853.1 ADP compounds hydrolase NudE [Pseudomonadales bacterium]MDP6827545.1 ADP compounds hydrolase NudE [Pseudomonadales bacterium]MDP6971323.1 ADP compounds hydrolase NudE [Pseudomonadales bacterium]|tara:strand:- start:578 stop:1138 length:561 start_codon:yes stop_codon:yes gene_type:complete